MPNYDEKQQDKREQNTRAGTDRITPEILANPIYTPGFLKQQIGKLMRVEFLIGTSMLTDRIGVLEEVGASYILLRSFECDSTIYCDIYSIKFITITPGGGFSGMNNRYQYY